MSAVRMAVSELRRITAGRMRTLAVVALAVIPLLYGGLYLYANHDPYGRLGHVPAAVVVDDRGATTVDGTRLAAGEQVAADLVGSRSFDWHRVSAAEADQGVRDGRYDFALTLPADFSAALASSARFEPRQGAVVLTTNDANNYVARTIAAKVTDAVRDSLARQVGEQAASRFLLAFATLHDRLASAVSGADRLAGGAAGARAGAQQLSSGAVQLAAGQRRLLAGSTALADGTAQLGAGARQLAAGAGQVAAGNARLAGVGDRIAAGSARLVGAFALYRSGLEAQLLAAGLTRAQVDRAMALTDRLRGPVVEANRQVQGVAGRLDRLAAGSAQVASGARRLTAGAARLGTGAAQLRDGEAAAVRGTDRLAAGARSLDEGLGRLATGSRQLRDGLSAGLAQVPDLDARTRAATARTIADPVRVVDVAQASAASYGAGLAPFFLSLAAWIGGYVLFLLVRPLSDRAMAADVTPLRVALGGWLAPAALGAVQVLCLFLLVDLGLGIVPAHRVATGAFLVLVSVTFIAVVQALNAWLGSAGQFLALVLMLLQLVTAGGTFPWQTIPAPLYALHQVLPMSYTVDGLRHLLYGGGSGAVAGDVAVLAGYLATALLLSALAARRLRVWSVRRIKPELVL